MNLSKSLDVHCDLPSSIGLLGHFLTDRSSMNAKQRHEAVTHFRCPHCRAQGAGFYYQEATITDWVYDAKNRRFMPEWTQPADELLGEQPDFEGQYDILCRKCREKVTTTFDATSFGDFLDSITRQYLETSALREEIRVQSETGMVRPGLRKKLRDLEKNSRD